MRGLLVIALVCATILVLTLAACGSSSLAGTTWNGAVALTAVSIDFASDTQFTSSHFGDGTYTIEDGQVALTPSAQGQTRVFVLDGSLMQGTVDGWPVTLTKQ